MNLIARVFEGHALDRLTELPDACVQCCVTSPPYWGLRDYGLPDSDWPEVRFQPVAGVDAEVVVEPWTGQLGLEACPWAYVAHLVAIFREVRRVLRADGTLWLNLGDCYAGSWGNQGRKKKRGKQRSINGEMLQQVHDGRYPDKQTKTGSIPRGSDLKPKDLVGIPWRVAMAFQADGWWLRSDNIWAKPNPMPESVRDRTTRSHEHVFLLAKSRRYFYDHEAIKEPSTMRPQRRSKGRPKDQTPRPNGHPRQSWPTAARDEVAQDAPGGKRNKRDVWWITPAQFPGSHYAVFPEDLVEPCLLAGTSETGCCSECGAPWKRIVKRTKMKVREGPGRQGLKNASVSSSKRTAITGTMQSPATSCTIGYEPSCECNAPPRPCLVLDPFAGTGTVGRVAVKHGRHFIGFDLAGGDCDLGDGLTPNGMLEKVLP